jgi:hypothetical protein
MYTEPIIFDVAFRIRYLRSLLLDQLYNHQRENILLAIRMYESGELPKRGTQQTWFLNGQVLGRLPNSLVEGSAVWAEVCLASWFCSVALFI